MSQACCQDFLRRDADLWKRAIEHPFLAQCKEASIPTQCFNWWLEQDFGFGAQFQELAKAILQHAPERDTGIIQEGIQALDAELQFFRVSHASSYCRWPICHGLILTSLYAFYDEHFSLSKEQSCKLRSHAENDVSNSSLWAD